MSSACAAHKSYGLSEFIASILCQSRLSKSVFVYALLYTHRFTSVRLALAESGRCGSKAGVDALPACPHCIFLGTLMIAFKFTNDNCYKIKYWAEWSKMSRSEITRLEIAILTALNYECVMPQQDFDQWAHIYSTRAARPDSTSLYAAIMLYAQAIRRLHRATVALEEQRAAYQQCATRAVDLHTGYRAADCVPGVAYASTESLVCGRKSETCTPSPTSMGIITPPATPACVVPLSSESAQHYHHPHTVPEHYHRGSVCVPSSAPLVHQHYPVSQHVTIRPRALSHTIARQTSVSSCASLASISSCFPTPISRVDSGILVAPALEQHHTMQPHIRTSTPIHFQHPYPYYTTIPSSACNNATVIASAQPRHLVPILPPPSSATSAIGATAPFVLVQHEGSGIPYRRATLVTAPQQHLYHHHEQVSMRYAPYRLVRPRHMMAAAE